GRRAGCPALCNNAADHRGARPAGLRNLEPCTTWRGKPSQPDLLALWRVCRRRPGRARPLRGKGPPCGNNGGTGARGVARAGRNQGTWRGRWRGADPLGGSGRVSADGPETGRRHRPCPLRAICRTPIVFAAPLDPAGGRAGGAGWQFAAAGDPERYDCARRGGGRSGALTSGAGSSFCNRWPAMAKMAQGEDKVADRPEQQRTYLVGQAQMAARPLAPALYLVATPIGNLSDITLRALETLAAADIVACEDTRVSRILLERYGIRRRTTAYHEHNALEAGPRLLAALEAGNSVALISDAGTPLVSDPGFRLVGEAMERGIRVVPVPGPSAALAALTASGLPSDTFLFAGFLPTKAGQLRSRLEELSRVPATLIFF